MKGSVIMSQKLFKRILSGTCAAILCLVGFAAEAAAVKNAAVNTASSQRINFTARSATATTKKAVTTIQSASSVPAAVKNLSVNTGLYSFAPRPNSGDVIQVVINGLDAITEKVIPAVIYDNDLDHVEYETTLARGTLQAKNLFTGNWKDCAEFEATLELEADFPVDSNDVTADFKTNRVVDTDWDIRSAELNVDLEVELGWGDDASNVWCWGWDVVTAVENLIGRTHLRASAEGLAGELKVAMKDASHSTIGISSVQTATLSFDEIDITKNDAINWLIDAGISIADMFGGSCSDLEDCVNDRIDDELNSKDILNQIKTGLNDAISRSATLQGGVDGEFDIDYDVLLAALSTNSSNQFATGWDAELSSDEAEDDCASDLEETTYGAITSDDLGGDVDVTIGFPLISKAAYEIGKQGLFCRTFSGTVESDDAMDAAGSAETGNDDADAAIGMIKGYASSYGAFSANYSGQLVPDGALVIKKADESNQVTVSLPVRLQDVEVSNALTGTHSADGGSEITADLELTTEIDVSCENGLYLKPIAAALTDLSGSVEFDGETVNAADFEEDLQDAVEDILEDMDAITLVPKINSLDTLGLGIEIDDVDIDSNSLHIAVNLTDDIIDCEDDDDGNGGGGGGPSPGPGGGPKGGIIILDPWDDDDGEDMDGPGGFENAEMETAGF